MYSCRELHDHDSDSVRFGTARSTTVALTVQRKKVEAESGEPEEMGTPHLLLRRKPTPHTPHLSASIVVTSWKQGGSQSSQAIPASVRRDHESISRFASLRFPIFDLVGAGVGLGAYKKRLFLQYVLQPKLRSLGMIKVSAVHGALNYLDLTGTLSRTRAILEGAADYGCQLIAFPGVYIAGDPDWVWLERPCIGKICSRCSIETPCGFPVQQSGSCRGWRGVCDGSPLALGRVHDQFTAVFLPRAPRTQGKRISKMGSVLRGDEQ